MRAARFSGPGWALPEGARDDRSGAARPRALRYGDRPTDRIARPSGRGSPPALGALHPPPRPPDRADHDTSAALARPTGPPGRVAHPRTAWPAIPGGIAGHHRGR